MNTSVGRGTASECLEHYFLASWNGDPRAALAELMGCRKQTINDWARKTSPPRGVNLLRVVHYLSVLGYEVRELESIDEDMRDLGLMIVLRVCTLDDVAMALGYAQSSSSEGHSALYRILLHGGGMATERAQKAQKFLEGRKTRLAGALEEFRARCPQLRETNIALPVSRHTGRVPKGKSKGKKMSAPEAHSPRTVHSSATIETVQITAALVQSLYRNVRALMRGPPELRDVLRQKAPSIRDLGQLLLVIDSQTDS